LAYLQIDRLVNLKLVKYVSNILESFCNGVVLNSRRSIDIVGKSGMVLKMLVRGRLSDSITLRRWPRWKTALEFKGVLNRTSDIS